MEVSFTKQELDSIIKELKHMTRREAIRLVFKDEKPAHLYSSKLGGLPYYGGQLVYPFNSEGEPMPLLLQLNLEELNIPCALPEKGLLQFFVSVFPMECKVIYQKDIDRSLDTVRPIPKAIPVFSEFALEFESAGDYMFAFDRDFPEMLKKAVKAVTGKETEGNITDGFSDGDAKRLCDDFQANGSKLFGWPCFTQYDAREKGDERELLLQLDSDGKHIMWGDWGVGNFFIKKEALERLDFTDVLFNWDCY